MRFSNSSVPCGRQTGKEIFVARWIMFLVKGICMNFYEACLGSHEVICDLNIRLAFVFGGALWAER